MQTAILQFQDVSGTWMTVSTNVDTNDIHLNMRLNELQKRYGGKRVRAIDSQSGAIIDIR
jgi:hypothetical protein